ncbi:exported hypothetical protein [Mesorhizobium plurifarium]|uniref:Uncharacterized protein n=1 Tax=Mesorhizobium plurifarium TaxID=69974 RepID=A0A090F8X9_MESPL|nr:exported hypothetical protein [Mesorhizobium plurifarium]
MFWNGLMVSPSGAWGTGSTKVQAGRALHPDGAARKGICHCLSDIRSRAAELPVWLHRYNWHRPHGSLKSKTPISRLASPAFRVLGVEPQQVVLG